MNQRREDRLTEIPRPTVAPHPVGTRPAPAVAPPSRTVGAHRPPRAVGAARPGEGVPVTAAAVADLARRTAADLDEEDW